jgi:hypothetical protein
VHLAAPAAIGLESALHGSPSFLPRATIRPHGRTSNGRRGAGGCQQIRRMDPVVSSSAFHDQTTRSCSCRRSSRGRAGSVFHNCGKNCGKFEAFTRAPHAAPESVGFCVQRKSRPGTFFRVFTGVVRTRPVTAV